MAYLGDQPELLRRLGLVVDLKVDDLVRLSAAKELHAELDLQGFQGLSDPIVTPVVRDNTNLLTIPATGDWQGGGLTLGDGERFGVLILDADGSALKRLFAGAGLKQVLPVGCGRSAFQVLHRPLAWAPLAKPFSTRHEAIRKQWRSTKPRLATVSGHGAYSRCDLSRISQERPVDHADRGGTPMIEALAAVLAFTSIGIFLAHAFDAYRTR